MREVGVNASKFCKNRRGNPKIQSQFIYLWIAAQGIRLARNDTRTRRVTHSSIAPKFKAMPIVVILSRRRRIHNQNLQLIFESKMLKPLQSPQRD